ncbi:hypothetical protein VD0002_g9879 [Verticillium dahliae]|uniref:Uncharacterized protein n=1 Tax=Verticillium dahliae TaxID=27337 RepID=A0AA44WAJ0_VERDA|nr:hypothetical protein BJF96_g9756 [Verticillium dahliae]PNH41049.1 hypothetical protein VD0003_g10021 [Verticillium dahliae]PNH55635.1 hypothetical protein VD0002_g9879 [Verticillium dahliae]
MVEWFYRKAYALNGTSTNTFFEPNGTSNTICQSIFSRSNTPYGVSVKMSGSATELPKFATKVEKPDDLRKECEFITGLSCDPPVWVDIADADVVQPSRRTAAIIVDMRNVVSTTVQVFDKNNKYQGEVDMNGKGSLWIVQWTPGWKFFSVGPCPIAQVKKSKGPKESKG